MYGEGSPRGGRNAGSSPPGPPRPAAARAPVEAPRFLEGSPAFHRAHGRVDVLAVVGAQRLIRVQTGAGPSEIAVLAVHVGELFATGDPGSDEHG